MNEEIKITSEDAKKILLDEQNGRVKKCSEEVKAVCEKYNCQMIPIIEISQFGNQAAIKFVPKQGE